MYATFAELQAAIPLAGRPQRCAVAGAADAHALEAVMLAAREGYLTPVLIGPKAGIEAVLGQLEVVEPYLLHDCPEGDNPAEAAVRLVRDGEADFILKGNLQTSDLLRPVLNKQTGLNDRGFVTHFGLMQLHGYHKLLAMSDSAVIPHPTLADKARIVEVCTEALRSLGIARPVVAALCAAETVNPKIPETIDAAELAAMSERGELGDTVVVGPVSFDLATSREAAAIKGYDSPYAGDVDMVLVPEMVTGNVMSKIWNADDRNTLAGCLLGARVPVALTSRSASMKEKLTSLLLCSLLSATTSTGAHA
ncbi:MAG: phosphate acyltransferase [Propionicimonas sp.]|uniref:phosphate acyltransferase n=1 Tax=Propionicimonas sp. TaxID=1955623 RepID=UPI002B20317E|nr:phosphate acyltransferase [Propionicimonas sp.]MEA4944015.1 phosphate acyltransferase [Propionicimonas sp.]